MGIKTTSGSKHISKGGSKPKPSRTPQKPMSSKGGKGC